MLETDTMNKFITILLVLISINAFGQNLTECGIDDSPKLTLAESQFLTEYMSNEQRKGFDFTNKKAIFVTGNSAHFFRTKSEYFDRIKEYEEKGNKIATWIVELNEKEKIKSGGYDVIITYWVKVLTKRRKRLIINEMEADR